MKEIFKSRITYVLRVCLVISIPMISMSMGGNSQPWSKENVSFPMMNLEIKATMKENERQKDMKSNQDHNTMAEVYNKEQWGNFKEKIVKIQDRLRIVSFSLQAIPSGIQIKREIDKIYENQKKIIEEIEQMPLTLVVILPSQIKFIDDVQMIIRYIAGIILSYGAINQMEKAERKILLDFAVDEIRILRNNSSRMLFNIREIKLKIKRNTRAFEFYVNRDKKVVEDILSNIKNF